MALTGRIRPEPRRRWLHRLGCPVWVFVWLSIQPPTALCGAGAPKEYQLKAAFLFNFTKFVEWSAQSLGAPDKPFAIGVFGSSPVFDELERAVENRKVNGHSITVKRVQSAAAARGVHLLFVSGSEDGRLGELREALHGADVLTVGESDAFEKAGGAITFVIEGDKVRFEINVSAAEQASVKISAQLQKLARSVRK